MRFGSYELIRKLGAGGMGEVFLATRLRDGVRVVIKRVLPSLAARPGFVDRFLDEVRALARLDHPHVVKVFDFGEVQGTFYLAMEWVDGRSLRAALPLSSAEALRVVSCAAQALAAAHAARDAHGRATPVVHRDVNPQNLMLGAAGEVKLIDFGIASLDGAESEGGTLAYAAPEQLLDGISGPAGDQYALGVVLWEALAGRPAFDGDDVEVIRLVTEVGVPPAPVADAGLGALVQRMTALDPAARFPSMADVVDALRPYAPVDPRPQRLESPALAPARPAPRAAQRSLSALEQAALDAVRDGMTTEEAEAAIDAAQLEGSPFSLDLLQDLVEKGALVSRDTGDTRRFARPSA